MEQTVESLCNQVARNRLLEPDAVRNMRQRWRNEAKDAADDAARFSRWMIASGYVTDFQFGMLTRGFADLLFVGEYKLLDRIGQGRMAGVYKGLHGKSGQVVAVKILPPSKAQHAPLLARFQREARLALRLKHPNVVRTFQVGKTKGEVNYIVMEYLDGETLEDVLQRRKRLPPNEAVHVLVQALRGLQHLDDEGLIHRDMKPANLMLVPPRPLGQPDSTLAQTVKILDIGLGRALFDEGMPGAADLGDLTSEGALLGTPNYMAPEQARDAHAADIRADIYSLGCVFYEMLTGQPPFPDTSVVRQMVRHAKEPPRPVRQLNPDVPEPFQAVLDSFLAKDPAQRYPTASAALKGVKALLPQLAEPPPPPEPGPQLRSYLTWLETRPADGETPPPLAATAPTAAAATFRGQIPAGVAAPRAPAAAAVAPASPPAAPIPAPVALAPVATPRAGLAVAQPLTPAPAAAAAAKPAPTPVAAAPPAKTFWQTVLHPTRRDLMFAGVGAACLLVLELILWLLVLILRS